MGSQESVRRFKAGIFQALAHPTRIFMVEALSKGELTVSSLCDLASISQSNASQHLAVLRHKQLVETRKDGNSIYYRLRDPALGSFIEAMQMQIMKLASDVPERFDEEPLRMRSSFVSSRRHPSTPR